MDSPELSISNESLLEHAAWVRKLARELVRDPGAADDLAQDTWLAFLRAKPDTERPLRPWLARVMRNAATLRARRSSGRSAREEEVARPEQVPSAHELVERAEQQRKLAGTVLALDDPYRTTLLLRYYEGLTPSQIAQARELPAATVRTHLHRGLAELRRKLDHDNDGDRRAWVVMLQPLLQRPEPLVGAGAATLAAAAVLAVIATIFAFTVTSSGSERPSLEGPNHTSGEVASSLLAVETAESEREPSASVEDVLAISADRSLTLQDSAGRPLAAFAVRVAGQQVVSDERGSITIRSDVRSLLPVDDARLALDTQVSHNDRARLAVEREPVEVPAAGDLDMVVLPTGPTYSIELSGAAGVDLEQLEARLVNPDSKKAARAVQVAPLRSAQPGFGTNWVRFADVPQGAEEVKDGWRLELRDALGLWEASAAVDSVELGAASTVAMQLESTAAVAGHLDGVSPEQFGDVTVVLLSKTEGGELTAWATPDEHGDYALRWVPAGKFVLRVVSPLHSLWSTDVELRTGERSVHDATLEDVSSAGFVRGSVTSESGTYAGQLLVFLVDAEGFPIDTFPTTWQRNADDQLEAAFEFEVTPTGALHIDVVSLADAVTFRAEQLSFEAPFESARATLLDEQPAADWSFEVVDDATGELIDEFVLQVNVDGAASRSFAHKLVEDEAGKLAHRWTLRAGGLRWNNFAGPAPLRALSQSAQITWTVRAEGYRDAQGSTQDFDSPRAERRHARVRLQTE